jgi:hypothetical protein
VSESTPALATAKPYSCPELNDHWCVFLGLGGNVERVAFHKVELNVGKRRHEAFLVEKVVMCCGW